MKLPERKCPECGGRISWITVHELGAPTYSGLCKKCNIVFRGRETPHITKGKNLERNGKIEGISVKDIHAMDKRITSLPCDVQIGILRARQHPDGGKF